MPSVAEDLYQYVQRTFPNHEVDLVYEAGCCGFTAARYFFNLGWNVLVVNPADVKTGDKERYQKNDALDSKNLSNQLKAGVLKGIYIPTEEHEQFMTLARHHTKKSLMRGFKPFLNAFCVAFFGTFGLEKLYFWICRL